MILRIIKTRSIDRCAAVTGLLMCLFLLIAQPLSAGTTTQVDVPDVVGLSDSEATAMIQAADLIAAIQYIYDNRIDTGEVISQLPQANTQADPGSTVTITVSLGPVPEVEVPNVVGNTLEEAEEILTDASFTMSVQTVFNSSQPLGVVIQQNPLGGIFIQQGTSVTVYFNESPTAVPVTVPDVTGARVNDAQALLETLGFNVLVLVEPTSSAIPGTVLNQHPAADSEAGTGTTITLLMALEYFDSRWISPLSSER